MGAIGVEHANLWILKVRSNDKCLKVLRAAICIEGSVSQWHVCGVVFLRALQ
jgi:hypothetical protein